MRVEARSPSRQRVVVGQVAGDTQLLAGLANQRRASAATRSGGGSVIDDPALAKRPVEA